VQKSRNEIYLVTETVEGPGSLGVGSLGTGLLGAGSSGAGSMAGLSDMVPLRAFFSRLGFASVLACRVTFGLAVEAALPFRETGVDAALPRGDAGAELDLPV
jgi:hypothetical protein